MCIIHGYNNGYNHPMYNANRTVGVHYTWECIMHGKVPYLLEKNVCVKNSYTIFNSVVTIIYWRVTLCPWLVWLSGLGIILQTKKLLVWFPVRAHAWVASQIPDWGHARGNCSMFLSHIGVSLPLFYLPFPSLKINKILKKKSSSVNRHSGMSTPCPRPLSSTSNTLANLSIFVYLSS